MTQNNWPEDKMQELLRLYNGQNWTVEKCARHFGVTRNVVTGKIKRGRAKYGFENRTEGQNPNLKKRKPAKPAPQPKQKFVSSKFDRRGKLPDANNAAIVIVGPNGLADSVRKADFKEPVYETGSQNVLIWDLQSHQCCWPVNGSGSSTMYCGTNKTTKSYCANHSSMAYRT